MTIAVDLGRKATKQTNKQKQVHQNCNFTLENLFNSTYMFLPYLFVLKEYSELIELALNPYQPSKYGPYSYQDVSLNLMHTVKVENYGKKWFIWLVVILVYLV